jgi:hypothetical protein
VDGPKLLSNWPEVRSCSRGQANCAAFPLHSYVTGTYCICEDDDEDNGGGIQEESNRSLLTADRLHDDGCNASTV